MPTISNTKELFALAGNDITTREKVIAQTTVAGTEDWYYYRGLVLLQKLSTALGTDATDASTVVRSPTGQESDLLKDMKQLLKNYKDQFATTTRFNELETRFYLLTWFVNGDSKKFVRDTLHLNLPTDQHHRDSNNQPPSAATTQTANDLDTAPEDESQMVSRKSYPSSLDVTLLDNDKVMRRLIDEDKLDQLKYTSLPIVKRYWTELNTEQQCRILERLLWQPVTTDTIPIVSYLADLWQPFGNGRRDVLAENMNKLPLHNLTLTQLDELLELLPAILQVESFVTLYMDKLVPHVYAQDENMLSGNNSVKDWDGLEADGDYWTSYLADLDQFADKLMDGPFRLVKARITFQKLKSSIFHGQFDQSLLLSYLAQSRVKKNDDDAASPVPSRSNVLKRQRQESEIMIPILGRCQMPMKEENQIIEEYISGLIRTQKLDSLDLFFPYLDQKSFLEPLQAQVMLTSGLATDDDITSWSNVLGNTTFRDLVKQPILTFGPATTHKTTSRLTKDDNIPVQVTIKNIPRLTLRVFPIDLFNYWKAHPSDTTIKDGNKLNVDGLCPVYEQQLDYSTLPTLQKVTETFWFGTAQQDKVYAPDVFAGRGAWMIDFIGGQDQCRAIVQKGYLRYAMQKTAGGHLFLVMDENNQVLKDSFIWLENESYQPDQSGNILIPYRTKESKQVRALLTSQDGYCQPLEFYHEEESYSLDASFYFNYESLIPTKQTKLIITPTLKIQDQMLPLELLSKISLEVVTTSSNDIKSSTTMDNLMASKGKPIECEFTVPSSLTSIKLTLTAKVRTMSQEQPWKQLEAGREIRCNTSDQDEIVTTHLRADNSGYLLYVIGKNGEPHKQHSLDLSLAHNLTYDTIDLTMQTNENGCISLGPLDNVGTISIQQPWKSWKLLGGDWKSDESRNETSLPLNIQYRADTEFKLPFTVANGSGCALFQTGRRGNPVADHTNRLAYTNFAVTVEGGLPEGSYNFYLSSPRQPHVDIIPVTIVNPSSAHQQSILSSSADDNSNSLWKKWLIGDRVYGETTGDIVRQPCSIESVKTTDKQLILKLKNETSLPSTFAIITASAFLPPLADSLSTQMGNVQHRRLLFEKIGRNGLDHIHLTGRKLGEEYQYILNRAKEDKYAGSSLPEPSLLVNPKEIGKTSVKTRSTGQGNDGFINENQIVQPEGFQYKTLARYCSGLGNPFEYTDLNYAFLNQNSRVVVLEANDQGEIVVDRSQLGEGNFIQAVVLSPGQATSTSLVLRDVDMSLQLNDQRQTSQGLDTDAAYLRSKLVTVLSSAHPQSSMEIDQNQHESELVDSQNTLLDIFKLLAPNQETELAEFDVLRRWATLEHGEKLKTHDKMNSYELNLWIKCKDVDYFNTNIKPFIKSKIQKTFMDDYLIDADLTKYATDLYLFHQLNVAEKALLAKRVPQILPMVLRLFKDNHQPSLSDQPFDTVLAGNVLAIPVPETELEPVSEDGFLHTNLMMSAAAAMPLPSVGSRNIKAKRCLRTRAPMAHVADFADEMEGDDSENDDANGDDQHHDDDESESDEVEDDIMALRNQAAKRRRIHEPYQYMAPTSEWTEKEYYGEASELTKVNQFWIDYLENNLSIFVSGNAIYATTNITEMIFALALIDLPIKSDTKYSVATDSTTGKTTIAATTPLIVFYRSLKKYTQSISANPTLLLGQHIFERNKDANDSTDDQHVVDPAQLLARTPYGWHLAVSNISTKTVICEVTLQVPTGAVPLGETPYCQSKNIMIRPYTTWHEVVGNFYFPTQGTFNHFAVTVSEQQTSQEQNGEQDGINSSMTTMVLLNQTQPMTLRVSEMDEQKQLPQSNTTLSAYASWSVVNNSGTSNDILAFVKANISKLKSLDWSLVTWRMTDPSFARSLLTFLASNKHYVNSIYAYGVYHGFTDIIADLLVQERTMLLQKTGIVFDCPLVKWQSTGQEHLKVLDYYPMANARVHSLGSSNEIANQEFYDQYNRFLEYLNQCVNQTANNYVTLSIYLILQGRIGEAQQMYNMSKQLSEKRQGDNNNSELATVQSDYLGAYLASRVKEGNEFDILTVKKMAEKYKSCGSLRWQKLFGELADLAAKVEAATSQQDEIEGGNGNSKATLGTDPVFDFTIKDNQVVVRYANVTEMQVRFYNINAEVMFSNQPFLNKNDKISNYSWVKANHVKTIDLQKQSDDDVVMVADSDAENDGDSGDFGWIGISKIRPRRHAVPIPLVGNLLVEVHAHGKTQCQTHFNHALTVHMSEQYGVARVLASKKLDSLDQQQQQPLPGAYVKVYAKLDNGRTEFWKDGYTSLTGVFDYISVTHGNALVGASNDGDGSLEEMVKKIKKFALLFSSTQHGVVVKEAYPPF
ncbi:hypothetical protein BCR42DRAFT_485784 [Absidia repens]|uniref:Uncharacterized protein n=1 Tax=Absidia repens TaxID=90262 RepID=A0A1X2J1G7_9FUNG|nr:hypothetical protein BCR42DRAFT_485784 [Absidia repens]